MGEPCASQDHLDGYKSTGVRSPEPMMSHLSVQSKDLGTIPGYPRITPWTAVTAQSILC